MSEQRVFVGTSPVMTDTILDEHGQTVNLAGRTVTLVYRPVSSATPQVSLAATPDPDQVTHEGLVSIVLGSPFSDAPAFYEAWWHVTGVGPTLETDNFTIVVETHGPSDEPSFGPTDDWCSTFDITTWCGDTVEGLCLDTAATMASEVLYELSGRQFLGRSSMKVRPCRQYACGFWGGPQILSEGHIVWHGHGWRDQNGDECGCTPTPEILLAGYPVVSIDEVKIDGTALAPTAYRLDQNRRLVRTDGAWWPVCQSLASADTQAGTWSVRYTFGTPPPLVGQRAAVQLGCEFYKLCAGGDCRLPSGVTQLVRQGVTVTRVANVFAQGGATGLELVDAFLAAYGGKGRPAAIWSPDVRYPRRVS